MARNIDFERTAVLICNFPNVKKEILCARGSVYDRSKVTDIDNESYYSKKKWNKIIENKVKVILKNESMEKHCIERIIGLVLVIGMRMLTWAEFHEGAFSFSREFSVRFLQDSFFTQQGTIDIEKAAEMLIKDESLNVKQKYKLACFYCFADHTTALYEHVAQEEFYDVARPEKVIQPELVKFWSCIHMQEIDKLKGIKDIFQYGLEKAIESGSKTGVEYCLEKIELSAKKDVVVDAAMKAVRYRDTCGPYTRKDLVVFRNWRYKDSEESWVPSDYYVDILYFFISKMDKDKKIEFLKKDIEDAKYEIDNIENHMRSRVLEYFLRWPYQGDFMKTAELMWEFLPERDFAVLLLKICGKIEFKEESYSKYGEEKTYDYRELLKEFWNKSPMHCKKYVSSNQSVAGNLLSQVRIGTGTALLSCLLELKNFTEEDSKSIKLILASATQYERDNIFSSHEWRNVCFEWIQEEKWQPLDRLALNCFSSKQDEYKFKRELSFTERVKCICMDFMQLDSWNALESFIKWSSLLESEVKHLKKEMIYSQYGKHACLELISNKNVKTVDKFIKWCLSSADEAKAFRKNFAFSDEGILKCADFLKKDNLELASEFINFCLPSEEVRKLKKYVAYGFGSSICKYFISGYDRYMINYSSEFEGGEWDKAEKFLTWCFSSEEEIKDFKKNKLHKHVIKEIHFSLINCCKWHEAETFFAWLGLSTEEIKELKKGTFFSNSSIKNFSNIIYSSEGDPKFEDYESKQEAMELLLRWHLSDKISVHEFQNCVKKYLRSVGKNDIHENFELAISNVLIDLDAEQRGVKRKFETSN